MNPVVLAATQVVVMREGRSLERRFGDAYRSYKTSVRRYPISGAGLPEAQLAHMG